MADIVIRITDVDHEKVSCVCEPSFEMMMSMLQSGSKLTAAHGYALHALNKIREKSLEETPKHIIQLPKAKKIH